MTGGFRQGEHIETIRALNAALARLGEAGHRELNSLFAPYLEFRERVGAFQGEHFLGLCRSACFAHDRADCCSGDDIGVFFADLVIDLIIGGPGEAERLEAALASPPGEGCAYLGEGGCVFSLKPVACEMFVCHRIKEDILENDQGLAEEWADLKNEERSFTWPSKPVLFDTVEAIFIREGLRSPLMFCHTSPGLLKLKERWAG